MSSEQEANGDIPAGPLRRGWTTGACATAATHAAYEALVTGSCPDPVEIELPSGARAAFAIATFEHNAERATAGVVKDAGDDPDVTHGALVKATVRRGPPGSGISFRAGEGVGTVTKPGLPLPPGLIEKERPRSVSPAAGSRSTVATRSMLIDPKTTIIASISRVQVPCAVSRLTTPLTNSGVASRVMVR